MNISQKGILFLFFGVISINSVVTLSAQNLFFSKEENIKNDIMYDYFNTSEDGYILFRNKGTEKTLTLFNQDLTYNKEILLGFEEDKVDIDWIGYLDSLLSIIYSYKSESEHFIKQRFYSNNLVQVDTALILWKGEKRKVKSSYKSEMSSNNELLCLFGYDESSFTYYLINSKTKQSSFFELEIQDIDLKSSFVNLKISDNGKVYITAQSEKKSKSIQSNISIISILEHSYSVSQYQYEETTLKDIKSEINNETNELVVAGLWMKDLDNIDGYFLLRKSDFGNVNEIYFYDFREEVYEDLFGKKRRKKLGIKDFYLNSVVNRYDGGVVLVAENEKEFLRRSSYTTLSRFDDTYSSRAFVDYFNDDFIIVSISPDNEEEWSKVLYKKQFSQDDGGIYSSYKLLKTKSRIHLIYNDEIKKDNTISAYRISPTGEFERNSIINTEYKNLKLRLKDAKQISSEAILVPSEKNGKLSLVKVIFD